MTLILELTPEQERQLEAEARRRNMDAEGYAKARLFQEGQQRATPAAPHLPAREAELLERINAGLPPETWQRYSALTRRREAETITDDEYAELLQLIDVVEADNAERIGHLIALARLRHTTLDALMRSLGIGPRAHV